MFKKFAKKFSNWKGEEKKVEKLEKKELDKLVNELEDLSGTWYENASSVFVSQKELESELFNPMERDNISELK
jgi:hypothetical protein